MFRFEGSNANNLLSIASKMDRLETMVRKNAERNIILSIEQSKELSSFSEQVLSQIKELENKLSSVGLEVSK